MKKNSLTTAIIAGVAGVGGLVGVANAVNLNPDGIGQVLLYPYYTVNGGQTTAISVVNTANAAKAVKVRFLESMNSKEVLDFNLYLSPYDVWTAHLVDSPSGVPVLTTEDTSCTVPAIPAGGKEFVDWEFSYWHPDRLGALNGVDSEANIPRLRQGHIEVIEMGDLIGADAAAVTHVQSGAGAGFPLNCARVVANWDVGGTWFGQSGGFLYAEGTGNTNVCPPGSVTDPAADACGPTGGAGGIFGSAGIVHVADGLVYSYNADAINGFYTLDGNLHYQPGTIYPRLTQAETQLGVAEAVVFNAVGQSVPVIFPTNRASAVSAVLSSRYIANEYEVVPGFAESDWVVTFPTKELHTYYPLGTATGPTTIVAPFTNVQGTLPSLDTLPAGTFYTNAQLGGQIFTGNTALCESIEFRFWDREEAEPRGGSGGFSPPRPGERGLQLCLEANVIGMGQTVAASGSTQVLKAPEATGGRGLSQVSQFQSGWARIGFTQTMASATDTALGYNTSYTITGLPVIGFWAASYTNEYVADGVTGYYNRIHRHRAVRDITVTTAP